VARPRRGARVAAQNLAELWAVLTRPRAQNGFGFAVELAAAGIERIEELFRLVPEVPKSVRCGGASSSSIG
jgi:hypothetical protein